MSRAIAVSVLAASLLATSCGGEGGAAVPAPLAQQPADASADVSADSADAGSSHDADAAPEAALVVRRTVVRRNPFGNVEHTDNLLLDGDFEWLGGYTSQYPWLRTGGFVVSFEPPSVEVGYSCHSGLKCASLDFDESVAGIGVRSSQPYLTVSLWARPPVPDCTLVSASVGSCFLYGDVQLVLESSPTPDADGWCHNEATVEAPQSTPCVFVSHGFEEPMLLDDVVMEASSEPGPRTRSLAVPSARHLASVGKLRVSLREFMKPKPPEWAPR